jgi:8-oxo-dGTP pyrophosphatase MutT (NUDIX family)
VTVITLPAIRERLRLYTPRQLPEPVSPADRAAVALVLAGPEDHLYLCFIRRAVRMDDHWSGQMALPGGWIERGDGSVRAAAERETQEEVGIELVESSFLGALSQQPIRHRGLDTDATLSPFVYYIGEHLLHLQTSAEVASAHWIALNHLWDPDQRTKIHLSMQGEQVAYPGIVFGDHVIWGLTLRVLTRFSEALEVSQPGA